jgi:PiT family inorganic phosphate transporter
VLGAALVGGPVSTTQVVSSAIIGAGSAERINKVRWQVGAQIVMTWIVTIPAAALFAALVYFVIRWFV